MDQLKEKYFAVIKRMEKIDFERLWPGFHLFSFVLFDETKACIDGKVVSRPDEFRANTAIEFEGRLLATWNLTEDDSDIDLLTVNIIHEMFHAFQMEQGETRFGDDLEAMMRPMEQDTLLLKYTENQLLIQSLTSREMFEHFVYLRQYRKSIAEAVVNYELAIETIEGMAEYVGLKTLEQISAEKYLAKVEQHAANLTNILSLLDLRRLAYSSGVILLLAAEKHGISVFHQLGNEKRNMFEFISDQARDKNKQLLFKIMKEQCHEREMKIQNVLKRGQMIKGDFEIRGFDPMNMFRQDDYIYGKHFWLLWDRKQQKTLSILGESVLKCDENGQISNVFT